MRIADYSGGSLADRARARRMAELRHRFPDLPDMHVVDLGGLSAFWRELPVHPRRVTVVNLAPDPPGVDWIDTVRADACTYAGHSADLVVSNSLIEHVGGHVRRQQLADTVRRLADRYWVQTPYRYFPMEPHWLFPGFQFLPLPLRAEVGLRWRRGHIRSDTRAQALADAMSVELIGITELQALFWEADIWRERFAGMVKSLVAVKSY